MSKGQGPGGHSKVSCTLLWMLLASCRAQEKPSRDGRPFRLLNFPQLSRICFPSPFPHHDFSHKGRKKSAKSVIFKVPLKRSTEDGSARGALLWSFAQDLSPGENLSEMVTSPG